VTFARSIRSIQADGPRRPLLGGLVTAAVLAGWSGWFFGVPVTVVEVTGTARLEVGRTAHPVTATAAGLVMESHVELGREVKAGEVLVDLDARALVLALAEKRASIAAIDRKVQPIADEITAQRRALRDAEAAARARSGEARARSREAEAAARFADGESERQGLLRADGLAQAVDVARAAAERDVRRAEVDAARIGERRVVAEAQGHDSELRGKLARLEREQAEIVGARATEEAAAASLEHAVELRRIRAPIDGTLGEVAALPRGAVLKEGDPIAAVVPAGQLRIIATFPPATAFGRIRPGQAARLRLDGFPWTQYGEVRARVSRVASEPREGQARVELTVLPDARSAIPMEHGLPGTLEIEIERALPAVLVLRAAGQMMRAGRGGGG